MKLIKKIVVISVVLLCGWSCTTHVGSPITPLQPGPGDYGTYRNGDTIVIVPELSYLPELVSYVTYYWDDNLIGTCETAPFVCYYPLIEETIGEHTIEILIWSEIIEDVLSVSRNLRYKVYVEE